MKRFAVALGLAVALGFLSLSSGTASADPPTPVPPAKATLVPLSVVEAPPGPRKEVASESRVCRVAESIEVRYSPKHPFRVGVISVGDGCKVTKKVVELSRAEFDALRAGGSLPSDALQRPDSASDTTVEGSEVANPTAAGSSWVVGVIRAEHFGIGMAEVKTGYEWSYDGSTVTGYWGPWESIWDGWCWGWQWLAAWWDTYYMPWAVMRYAMASFDIDNPICPDLGYGGTLTTRPTGWYDGYYSVICWEDFTGPWPTRYICYADGPAGRRGGPVY